MTRVIEFIGVIVLLVSTAIGALLWLNNHHAADREVSIKVLDIRQESLEDDIDDDAASASHYRRLLTERPLLHSEQARLDYLEGQLERKYRKSEMLEQEQARLTSE